MIRNDIPQPIGTLPQEVLLPLAGPDRGTHTLSWDWDHYRLGQDLAGLQRIFYGDDEHHQSCLERDLACYNILYLNKIIFII